MADMHKINRVEVRNLQMEDYGQLAQSFTRVYADKDVFWTREQIHKLIDIFPEGQIVTVVGERIVGCALSIIVDYDMVKGDHTYAKVTGNETFSTHNPKGNILYGIEVFIHPDYRGLRLARRMYDYRKELCEKLNLKAIMFGGRIPNYHKYADRMRPKEYIDRVRSREIYDPVLTFQLSNDFHVRRHGLVDGFAALQLAVKHLDNSVLCGVFSRCNKYSMKCRACQQRNKKNRAWLILPFWLTLRFKMILRRR